MLFKAVTFAPSNCTFVFDTLIFVVFTATGTYLVSPTEGLIELTKLLIDVFAVVLAILL